MKKHFGILIVLLLVICYCLTACADASQETAAVDGLSDEISISNEIELLLQINNPNMKVNSNEYEIDPGRGTVPIIKDGRTLVPIRAIIEAFGGTVNWDGSTQTVVLGYCDDTVTLSVGSTLAYVNDKSEILDVAPQIINGRTMLPIRFIAESFDFDVLWIGEYSCIAITNNNNSCGAAVPDEWKKADAIVGEETSETSGIKQENDSASIQISSELEVHFIDVGQGDSIFIELPNSETMLIDAGYSSTITTNYVKNLGYSKLNYVVATHPDADHITGMPTVLNSFEVGTFYMPEKEHTTKIFEQMLDALAANGCNAEYALAGKEILNSDELKLYFVGPTRIYGDNNNCSAVVKLEYKDVSFLFTGDAEHSAENDMIDAGYNLQADILKVGHHGSSSSTSETFLNAVNPKESILSVGKSNRYGHPTSEILNRLSAHNINIYRTDEAGTIIVKSDGNTYSIDKLKSTVEANAPPIDSTTQESVKSTEETDKKEIQETQSNNDVVYRTRTGSKYHRAGCSYLKSSIQTTVSEAKNMGLTPCSRCNPPQ